MRKTTKFILEYTTGDEYETVHHTQPIIYSTKDDLLLDLEIALSDRLSKMKKQSEIIKEIDNSCSKMYNALEKLRDSKDKKYSSMYEKYRSKSEKLRDSKILAENLLQVTINNVKLPIVAFAFFDREKYEWIFYPPKITDLDTWFEEGLKNPDLY